MLDALLNDPSAPVDPSVEPPLSSGELAILLAKSTWTVLWRG
jgi:hypothetical protein